MKGQKISEEQYQQILQLYLIHGKVSTVSKISKLHYNTVLKYKNREKWDELRDKERTKTVVAVGNKIRDSLKENLEILGELKDYGMKKIRELCDANGFSVSLTNLLKIIELESELAGFRPPEGDKELKLIIQQYNIVYEKEGADGIARLLGDKEAELAELAQQIKDARLGNQSGENFPVSE